MIYLEISDMSAVDKASTDFAHAGNDAARAIDVTMREINGGHAPWGGDAPGQAFWNAYRGAATTTVANASQVGLQLETLGSNTAATIAMYRANEERASDLTRGVTA